MPPAGSLAGQRTFDVGCSLCFRCNNFPPKYNSLWDGTQVVFFSQMYAVQEIRYGLTVSTDRAT